MSLDRDNLEGRLPEHPEAKDDLRDLEHLRALYQSAGPAEPSEDAWNAVQSRIHAAVGRERSGRDRRPRWWWALAGLTAASVLVGALTVRFWRKADVSVAVPEPRVEEAFPVVDPEDVTIISIDARDVAALVVGEPPVSGDLEFVRSKDIHVIRCERCPLSGRKAQYEPEGEVPMFVTAAKIEQSDDQ